MGRRGRLDTRTLNRATPEYGGIMTARASARGARGMRTRRSGLGMALGSVVALLAVGCGGSDQSGEESSGEEREAASNSPKAPDSSSPGGTASAKPSAADGRDVEACADSNCEIAVSEPSTVAFKGPAGPATLTVTEVGPNEVEYTVKSGNGRSQGGASGSGQGCVTVVRSNGGGNSCGGVGTAEPSAQPDAVVIQVATGKDGTAIIQFVSD